MILLIDKVKLNLLCINLLVNEIHQN